MIRCEKIWNDLTHGRTGHSNFWVGNMGMLYAPRPKYWVKMIAMQIYTIRF